MKMLHTFLRIQLPVFSSILLILLPCRAAAQADSVISALSLSGYLEAYYSYDAGNPSGHQRQPFMYSYNRHNEVNLNLGFVKAAYTTARVRANLALMAGTYSNENLAAEPATIRNVFEANAGVKIADKHDLWVDGGVFASHIGFESAVGKDCWNLTRSIVAENTPYYESGAKLGYTSPGGKLFVSALLLNGWQRIYRVNGNNTPAFGHQLTLKPNSSITLNSSSFIGSDKPDSVRLMRYFHNFYGIFQFTSRMGMIFGFDTGAEQASGGGGLNVWYSPVLILRYKVSPRCLLAARGEYYADKAGVIISTGTPHGFRTLGYSVNFDYNIRDNVVWRIEGRGFRSEDEIFELNGNPARNNFFGTTSLAVSIQ